ARTADSAPARARHNERRAAAPRGTRDVPSSAPVSGPPAGTPHARAPHLRSDAPPPPTPRPPTDRSVPALPPASADGTRTRGRDPPRSAGRRVGGSALP